MPGDPNEFRALVKRSEREKLSIQLVFDRGTDSPPLVVSGVAKTWMDGSYSIGSRAFAEDEIPTWAKYHSTEWTPEGGLVRS